MTQSAISAWINASFQVRKPYTITKQRERWTDEEHELFLEALDKHGRAWRSIQGVVTCLRKAASWPLSVMTGPEPCPDMQAFVCAAEHIGTKTTVQIRSHAQKFFSKVEKEKRPHRAGLPSASCCPC